VRWSGFRKPADMSEDRQASPANRAEETVQAIAFGDDSVLYKVVPANAENATLTCHVKLLELLFVSSRVHVSAPCSRTETTRVLYNRSFVARLNLSITYEQNSNGYIHVFEEHRQ